MLFFLSLLGCSGLGLFSSGHSPGDMEASSFEVMFPTPGARVPSGLQTVQGTASSIEDITVNGTPASLAGGIWLSEVGLTPGINTLDLSATGWDETTHQQRFSVLAGEFAPASVAGQRALAIHVDADGFTELVPLAASLLDPQTLLGDVGGGQPIYQDQDFSVYLAGIDIPVLDLSITPRQGHLDVRLDMPGMNIPLDVETEIIFGIDISLNANLRMDHAAITGDLYLAEDGRGGLDLSFDGVDLQVVGVEIDIDGVADFLEDLFLTDEAAGALLADNIDPLVDAIPGLLEDALGDLGDLSFELDLLEIPLVLDIAFSQVQVNPGGLSLGMDLGVAVDGVQPVDSLIVGVPETGSGLAIQLSDDALNHALETLWAAGGLDLTLPLEPGTLDSMLLAVFGGDPATGGSLTHPAGLPPVGVGRGGGRRMQLGETLLSVDTPGGLYGDQVQVIMAADMALGIAITDVEVGAQLSDATVKLVPIGDAAEALAPEIEELEQTIGAGIGMLNGLLSFPLGDPEAETEEGGGLLGGLELPAFSLERDPTDRATLIALEL